MTIPDRADPSQPVECFLAVRILHQQLKPLVGQDPAPWLTIPQWQIDDAGREDPQGYVFNLKLHDRTKLTMSGALLNGDLRALVTDGSEVRAIPGWAWRNPHFANYVWNEGRLPLDPRLPDDWLRWSCHRPYLDPKAFNGWLAAATPERLDTLPLLPPPFDRGDEPPPRPRLPPAVPFVTLTEALTWIAFGCAVDREGLYLAFEGGTFGEELAVRNALESATARLVALACGGLIGMRGKYVEGSGADEGHVLTKPVEAYAFHDFAQFDSLYDGLSYGTGLTWERGAIDRIFPSGRDDSYRAVVVNREDLLTHCGPHLDAVLEARKVPANRQLDHEAIRGRAKEMRAQRPALTKGSAAASIVAELRPHPRTGKPRDQRHIERLIARLWDGGF